MELTAATSSIKVTNMLVKELDYQQHEHIYWTDSSPVFPYMNNETMRFPVFLANIVQTIRGSIDASKRRYVESKSNPADVASRCLNGAQFLK